MTDFTTMTKAREELGEMWGLGRPLTFAEMGRALKLSPKFGGGYIGKVERGEAQIAGPTEVAVQLMLDGAVPRHATDIVKPGYPRGSTE